MICENCGKEHNGSYGSGRFCSKFCARSFSTKYNRNEINKKISNTLKAKPKQPQIHCKVCNKVLRKNNVSGFCRNCLLTSDVAQNYRSIIGKTASSAVKNHKYWQPRNQISYAEKFWITVLNNNNIKFEHDFPIHVDNKHRYFLDFYIVKNNKKVDLEIDGKQHEYLDRQISDRRRDEYLTSKSYIVYRIKWNEINSEKGKFKMKRKIDNFLQFYKSL